MYLLLVCSTSAAPYPMQLIHPSYSLQLFRPQPHAELTEKRANSSLQPLKLPQKMSADTLKARLACFGNHHVRVHIYADIVIAFRARKDRGVIGAACYLPKKRMLGILIGITTSEGPLFRKSGTLGTPMDRGPRLGSQNGIFTDPMYPYKDSKKGNNRHSPGSLGIPT